MSEPKQEFVIKMLKINEPLHHCTHFLEASIGLYLDSQGHHRLTDTRSVFLIDGRHNDHCNHNPIVACDMDKKKHGNACKILTQRYLCIVMDVIKSTLLQDLNRLNLPLHIDNKIRRFTSIQQFTNSLVHLHQHKILHLDIHPRNIFNHHLFGYRFGDYGLSRYQDGADMLDEGQLMAIGWRAPEVYAGVKHATRAIDLFGLGIVIYQVLFGHQPFYPEIPNDLTSGFQRLCSLLQLDIYFFQAIENAIVTERGQEMYQACKEYALQYGRNHHSASSPEPSHSTCSLSCSLLWMSYNEYVKYETYYGQECMKYIHDALSSLLHPIPHHRSRIIDRRTRYRGSCPMCICRWTLLPIP
jgi:serine/threonine protein kinase